MSALLRAIRYADDASYRLAGYRKLDPITSLEGEMRFLEAAEALFFKGESEPIRVQLSAVLTPCSACEHVLPPLLRLDRHAFRLYLQAGSSAPTPRFKSPP